MCLGVCPETFESRGVCVKKVCVQGGVCVQDLCVQGGVTRGCQGGGVCLGGVCGSRECVSRGCVHTPPQTKRQTTCPVNRMSDREV